MAAFALKSGNVTVTADLRKETRFRDDFLRGRGVVGALAVPLHVNAKPFGVLGVYTNAPRRVLLGRRHLRRDDRPPAQRVGRPHQGRREARRKPTKSSRACWAWSTRWS